MKGLQLYLQGHSSIDFSGSSPKNFDTPFYLEGISFPDVSEYMIVINRQVSVTLDSIKVFSALSQRFLYSFDAEKKISISICTPKKHPLKTGRGLRS